MSQGKRDDRARRRPARADGARHYRADPAGGKPSGRSGGARARRRLLLVALAALAPAPTAAARAADAIRATPCQAPDAPAGPRLRVSVSGARRAAGNVTVTLYGPRREDFLARGGRLARQRVPLAAGSDSVEACFALSAPGPFAVAVYHDENDDRDFNRHALGLPAEGYGFSNDAPTALGVPSFDQARFTVPAGGGRIAIRLRY